MCPHTAVHWTPPAGLGESGERDADGPGRTHSRFASRLALGNLQVIVQFHNYKLI